MNEHETDHGHENAPDLGTRTLRVIDSLRGRVGASRRQFVVFAALLMVACGFWARPAGSLIWHRLRIVTGMPRMAIANEDPERLADAGPANVDPVDAGLRIALDTALLRDPFEDPSVPVATTPEEQVASPAETPTTRPQLDRLRERIDGIRLTGTSRGLGSAVLDGRVRVVSDSFLLDEHRLVLEEVRSGAVVLATPADRAGRVHRFLLDRNGAEPMAGE